jgi:type IV pilus assembly protein PilO
MMEKFNQLPAMARLAVFVVLAVAVGAVGWYVYPGLSDEIDKIAADQKVLDAKKADNAKLKPFEGKLNELEKDIANLQVQMERQKKIVPDEKSADEFIREMQKAAAEAGIELRSYASKPVTQRDYYVEVPFTIELDGPFYSVVNFFERVSTMERIVNIDGLKMGSLTSTRGGSVTQRKFDYAPTESVAVQCTATTFFRREQAQPATLPAKTGTAAAPAGGKKS